LAPLERGGSGNHPGPASIPHASIQTSAGLRRSDRRRLAELICRPDSFKVYRQPPSNHTEPGLCNVGAAVDSGRPYLGSTRPYLWAIDVDQPDLPSYATLRALLDLSGAEWLEGDSGRHRHLIVCDPDGSLRASLPGEVTRQHAVPGIDFRLQKTGSAIRPFGSPHRLGGYSTPDDIDEAFGQLERWLAAHGDDESGTEPKMLPTKAIALRSGEHETAERLGHRLRRRPDGTVDRSAADLSLALYYLNADLSRGRYIDDLRPGGAYPSPKAADSATPDAYLRDQWAAAEDRPRKSDGFKEGLEYLAGFGLVVEQSAELSAGHKRLLAYLISEGARVGKTRVSASQRDLRYGTGLSRTTIQKLLNDPALAPWVQRIDPNPAGSAKRLAFDYRLKVSEKAVELVHARQSPPVTDLRGSHLPVSRNHLAFGPVSAGGLGPKAYETLLGYSLSEPRNAATAFRAGGDVCDKTFRAKTDQLVEIGVLVKVDRTYVVCETFDWTRFVIQSGVCEAKDDEAKQIARERSARDAKLGMPPSPKAKALSSYDPTEQSAWVDEVSKRTEEAYSKAIDRVVPAVVQFGLIDGQTGELLGAQSIMETPSTRSLNCACCGAPTQRIEPSVGLPWGEGCLMPGWLVRHHESRLGLTIPAELRSPPPKRLLDNEWDYFSQEEAA
jgi:hypothetical protein